MLLPAAWARRAVGGALLGGELLCLCTALRGGGALAHRAVVRLRALLAAAAAAAEHVTIALGVRIHGVGASLSDDGRCGACAASMRRCKSRFAGQRGFAWRGFFSARPLGSASTFQFLHGECQGQREYFTTALVRIFRGSTRLYSKKSRIMT